MISDAQFSAWLATDAKRVLLAEVDYAYESGGAPAEGTIYLASGRYSTTNTDSPAHRRYIDCIRSASVTQEVDIESQGGRTKMEASNIALSNADGELDFLLDVVLDGYEVRFYLGADWWARSDFRLVLVCISEWVEAGDEERVTLKVRDKRLLLDREIKGDVMGGSGPNATKFVPLLYGFADNVDLSGLLYDATTLEYSALSNYGTSTSGFSDVRDIGLSLRSSPVTWTSADTSVNTGTDVLTHVAHGLLVNDVVFFVDDFATPVFSQTGLRRPFAHTGSAAQLWVKTVPSADTVTFSLTKGGATLDFTASSWNPDNGGLDLKMVRQKWYDNTRTNGRIQLSASPAGRLTGDITSFQKLTGVDGDWFIDPEAPFDLAGGLMYGFGNIGLADMDLDTFVAADAALDAKVAVGLSSLWLPERRNLGQVIDEWLANIFGFYGQTPAGLLMVGLLDLSGLSSATATRSVSTGIIGDVSCRNLRPTLSEAHLQYEINQSPQPDGLSATLTDEQRTKYSAAFAKVQSSTAPSGTAYATNKPLYHKTMSPAPPRSVDLQTDWPAYIGGPFPIGDYANEIVADHAPHIRAVSFTLKGLDAYEWRLGDVVLFTFPRFGFDAGVKCRLARIDVDFIDETVGMTLLTQIAPDTTTASYP